MQEIKQEKSPIKKRILQYLDYKGVSQYEFYKNTGVTRGVLTQNNGISEENITRFLAFFGDISPNWLLTGEGDMLKSSSKISPSGAPVPAPEQSDQLPGTECQLCKEKDERIKDLQKMVKFQSDTISSILQQIEPIHKQDSDLDDTIGTRTG
jgi:hypothetical protein